MNLARIKDLVKRITGKIKHDKMAELQFVIPGFYRDKYTSGQDSVVIRVLGESPEREGYFQTADGKFMSESDILTNYVFMGKDTIEAYQEQERVKISKLMRGVDKVITPNEDLSPVDLHENNPEPVKEDKQVIEHEIQKMDEVDVVSKTSSITYNENNSLEYLTINRQRENCDDPKTIFFNFVHHTWLSFDDLSAAIKILNLDPVKTRDMIVDTLLTDNDFIESLRFFVQSKLENPSMGEDFPVMKPDKPPLPEVTDEMKREIYEEARASIETEQYQRLQVWMEMIENKIGKIENGVDDKVMPFIERVNKMWNAVPSTSFGDIDPGFAIPATSVGTKIPSVVTNNAGDTGNETLDQIDEWMKAKGIL